MSLASAAIAATAIAGNIRHEPAASRASSGNAPSNETTVPDDPYVVYAAGEAGQRAGVGFAS